MKHFTLNILFLLNIMFYNRFYATGFITGTLVNKTTKGISIEHLIIDDQVLSDDNKILSKTCAVTNIYHFTTNHYIKIKVKNIELCCLPSQLFYSVTSKKWIQAQTLKPKEKLLTYKGSCVSIKNIQHLYKLATVYSLSVDTSHIFFVSPYKIMAHNCEPGIIAATTALSLSFPPAAPIIISAQVLISGLCAATSFYFTYKKYKNKKTFAEINQELKNNNCINGSPKKPNDKDEWDPRKHPNGRYEKAPYHNLNSKGTKSPCPKDGQKALDSSILVRLNNFKLRVSVCDGEIVILRYTSPEVFHGYVTTWENITQEHSAAQHIRNALIKSGCVNQLGKIVKNMI